MHEDLSVGSTEARIPSTGEDQAPGRRRFAARTPLAVLTAAVLLISASPAQAAPVTPGSTVPISTVPISTVPISTVPISTVPTSTGFAASAASPVLDTTLAGTVDHACLTVPGIEADCDGQGRALNRNDLRDKGLVSGGTITLGSTGLTADIPATTAGERDSLTGRGQQFGVDLGAGATRLSLVGFANNGTVSGSATITYTDGTTQPFILGFGDWVAAADAPIAGNRVLLTTPRRILADGGSDTVTTAIYYLDPIPLRAGKTVRSVTVPHFDRSLDEGQLHILAVASDGTRSAFSDVQVAPRTVAGQRVDRPFTADLAVVTGGRSTGGYLATVTWGDESPVSRITTAADGVVTGTHTYDRLGTFPVHVVVTDGLTVTATDVVISVQGTARTPGLTLSVGSRRPGQKLVVLGTGFGTTEQVDVDLYTDRLVRQTVTSRPDGSFRATLTVPRTARVGTYRVEAVGLRSQKFAGTPLRILPRVSPHLGLSLSRSRAPLGAPVVFTASTPKTVRGVVEFRDGSRSIGRVTLTSGRATLRVSHLAVGTHRITARFPGNDLFLTATTPAKTLAIVRR